MSGYILALDQGTTSSRAILYDDLYMVHKNGSAAHDFANAKSGVCRARCATNLADRWLHDVINCAGLLATDVASIAITNQRESIVMWDRQTGKPLAPAIIWQDRRTEDYCRTLAAESVAKDSNDDMASEVQRITGLRLDPYFSASKIAWDARK